MGRFLRITVPALLMCALLTGRAVAQSPISTLLFERYLDALRVQAGIPGMSGVIVQNGTVAWKNGFGLANIEHGVPAEPDTPYQISGLTEIFTSALILEQCVETNHISLDDTIAQRALQAPDPRITIRDALLHRSAAGTFKYDTTRFTALTGVVEACGPKDLTPYRQALAQGIIDRYNMPDSAPAANVGDASADDRTEFTPAQLLRYSNALGHLATPYKVSNGNPSIVTTVPSTVDAASGAISSALDLATFDEALDDGGVVHHDTMSIMWTPGRSVTGAEMPTGLGWFIQNYNGQTLFWQFGAMNGYSALMIKVPAQRLTLILLANSDGLTAPFALQNGDITTSLFARTFLKLFVG